MRSLAVLRELPAHFEVVSNRRGVLAVRRSALSALRSAGFDVESDGAARPSDLGGRTPLLEIDGGGARFVVRSFTHGGLLRWLTGRRFFDPERPFRELLDSERLARAGVPTPVVIAARARRAPFAGWHLTLVTQRVETAIDLGRAWSEASDPVRRVLLVAAGNLVARLHALGFVHADLHPRNLLVEECADAAQARLLVIDLDRSTWRRSLSAAERRANLCRMLRYAVREYGCNARDCARFLRAYQPDRAARHADWCAIEAAYLRTLRWHAGGWWFERRLGRRSAPKSSR